MLVEYSDLTKSVSSLKYGWSNSVLSAFFQLGSIFTSIADIISSHLGSLTKKACPELAEGPHRLARSRTAGSHPVNPGSNPGGVTCQIQFQKEHYFL